MKESLIKSKHRVQKHGEVFTPSWMVQKMLNTPGVKEACEDIYSTFLEPAAGDGNFLQAILERKLESVKEQYDEKNWKTKSLWALSSIYGIEYLEDNLEVARSRMFLFYLNWYEETFGEKLSRKSDICQSVNFIIIKNIVRGNTLTRKHPETDNPIRFYEWQKVKNYPSLVEPKEFIFASLFGEDIPFDKSIVEGQLSLFDFEEEKEVKTDRNIVDIKKIYLMGE